jgi:tetratricopeptide (TPR) repeat protein
MPFLREFVQQAQEDPRLEAERGRAYADLGFLSRELGEHERALSDLDEAGKVFARLAAGWPDAEYRRGLAEVRNSQGGVLAEMGRAGRADQAFRQAHDLLDGPGSAPAAAAEDRDALARTCSSWGELHRTLGRLEQAEALLRRAVALREGLLAERPGPAIRGQLAHSWINLGAVLRARRQPDPAEDAYRNALKVLDAAGPASGPPAPVSDQRARAQALNNLAIVLREQGHPADAETAHRESVAIKEKVAATYPSVPLYRQELARSLNNLGIIRSDLGRLEQAQEAYEKAIAAYERLATDFPGVPGYAIELAGTYSNMGRLVADRGQLEASLPWLAKAIQTVEPAYRRDPRIVKVRETLCVAHWTRATTLAGLGRFEPALADWDRAIDLDDGRYHAALRLERASARLNRKDPAGAAADARAVAESAQATAKDLYQAAACWALAARLVAGDAAQADRYAAQAVGALRRAAAKGYPNPVRWKDDPDLRDLQSRDDFRQLLSELAAKVPEAKPGQ